MLVTGAGSGIGRVWAEGFAREGATVFAADIVPDGIEALRAFGVKPLLTDVADASAVEAMIEAAVSKSGRLDVLFNNAGLGFGRRIEDAPAGVFESHVAVHLFGTVNGMRCAIPHMRDQGYGRIINTISRHAEADAPGHSAYAAAKAAIWTASRTAAREVEDADILINMLIPGPTNTGIWGRDMPNLQAPEVTWPTARMLATLPADGPSGKVFWNEKEYAMFAPEHVG